jgi:hypothetical protein
MSKGSGRRPSELSEQEWSNRWDAIFGRDEPPKQESKDEPWSPVSIGVDVTSAGAHVIGIYALDADTSQIFYAKHHPAPQRKPLTDEEIKALDYSGTRTEFVRAIEAAHGIKGGA